MGDEKRQNLALERGIAPGLGREMLEIERWSRVLSHDNPMPDARSILAGVDDGSSNSVPKEFRAGPTTGLLSYGFCLTSYELMQRAPGPRQIFPIMVKAALTTFPNLRRGRFPSPGRGCTLPLVNGMFAFLPSAGRLNLSFAFRVGA